MYLKDRAELDKIIIFFLSLYEWIQFFEDNIIFYRDLLFHK